MTSINTLVKNHPVTAFLVGWDEKKLTPYIVEPTKNIEYTGRSSFDTTDSLMEYAKKVDPDVVFVSGWMDKAYLQVARYFKKRNKVVVSFLDNPWTGTTRQRIGQVLSPWMLKRRFSHLWVSGQDQYVFGRKMGYDDASIFRGFYTADTTFFHQLYEKRNEHIRNHGYPKNITFVGRFSHVKGVDILIDVFNQNCERWNGWTLTLIGNGDLKQQFETQARLNPRIIIKDFIQPAGLPAEILNAGIFCLPSRKEPWGVVIHEFASAGVPLLTSSICGASNVFIEEGQNGYRFQSESIRELQDKLDLLIQLSADQLMTMGAKSYALSKKITTDTWASTAMRIISLTNT